MHVFHWIRHIQLSIWSFSPKPFHKYLNTQYMQCAAGSKVNVSVKHMNYVEWVSLLCGLAEALRILPKYVLQLYLHLQVLFDHPTLTIQWSTLRRLPHVRTLDSNHSEHDVEFLHSSDSISQLSPVVIVSDGHSNTSKGSAPFRCSPSLGRMLTSADHERCPVLFSPYCICWCIRTISSQFDHITMNPP